MAVASAEIHRWTRKEYERLAAKGLLSPDARVELIDGIIYDKAPQTSFHSSALCAGQEALRAILTDGFDL